MTNTECVTSSLPPVTLTKHFSSKDTGLADKILPQWRSHEHIIPGKCGLSFAWMENARTSLQEIGSGWQHELKCARIVLYYWCPHRCASSPCALTRLLAFGPRPWQHLGRFFSCLARQQTRRLFCPRKRGKLLNVLWRLLVLNKSRCFVCIQCTV